MLNSHHKAGQQLAFLPGTSSLKSFNEENYVITVIGYVALKGTKKMQNSFNNTYNEKYNA